MKPVLLLWIVLLLTGLACNVPAYDDGNPSLSLPTPAPTQAPSPGPGDVENGTAESTALSSGGAFPLLIQHTGRRSSYAASSSVATWCQDSVTVVLTINQNGSAQLKFSGPMINDHINCKASNADETWYMEGKADLASQWVEFQTCNEGRFKAAGSVQYSEAAMEGEVSCFGQNGERAVSIQLSKP